MTYEELPMKTIDENKIQKDDIMSFTYYVKVKKVEGKSLIVENLEDHSEIQISGIKLIQNAASANVYDDEVKESKTKVAEMLVNSNHKPFTVCFEKADGTERILRGRLIHQEPLLGRSKVEDLEVQEQNKMRLVDHRTIKWLIINNTKYIVH